ncbi:MAG: glycosyltransferase family protein [Solirubrobacterales bacterium]
MRILYGVNGEGMGHATRSEVVIGSLLDEHDVRVMASGAAFRHLDGRLDHVERVFGPSFAMEEGEIRRWATVTGTVAAAGRELPDSLRRWLAAVEEWRPEVVVTDFEPLAGIYARWSRTPLVCVDNIHMIDRCEHDAAIVAGAEDDYRLARAVTRAMVPNAGDYVVTTFFRPPLAKGRTTLVPPILRPAVVEAEPRRGEHLLVYSGGSGELIEALRECGVSARVYGMRDGAPSGGSDGGVEFRPRSVDGFLADLVSARAVITGGGFSLLSEAVYLGKPVFSVPLRGQFEQLMNARYLEREGFGVCAPRVDREALSDFLSRLDEFEARLAAYGQDGNREALAQIGARVGAAGEEGRRERARARRAARKPASG